MDHHGNGTIRTKKRPQQGRTWYLDGRIAISIGVCFQWISDSSNPFPQVVSTSKPLVPLLIAKQPILHAPRDETHSAEVCAKQGMCMQEVESNYFTSSDPHHDMLGGGCQVRVVIENMMGRMENLKTLISGFLGLVILVRWALVTMFLSWTTQTGCRIHRTYVSLIGSGEGRHTTHLLKCVLLLSTSQTDWKQSSDVLSDISFDILSDKSSDISSDILSDISSDILSDIFLTYLLTFFLTNLLTLFLTYLLTFFLTYLSTCFLTYLLTFFLTYQNQNLTSTASHKKPLCKLYIYVTPRSKSNIHDNFVPVNVIALSASDRPAKRQLSPKMQNACSSTHTPHASDRPAKQQLSPKMQKSLKCHNYISWRVQTMKSDARHCGSSAGSA